MNHWIGLQENLRETPMIKKKMVTKKPWFPVKMFSRKPIQRKLVTPYLIIIFCICTLIIPILIPYYHIPHDHIPHYNPIWSSMDWLILSQKLSPLLTTSPPGHRWSHHRSVSSRWATHRSGRWDTSCSSSPKEKPRLTMEKRSLRCWIGCIYIYIYIYICIYIYIHVYVYI